MTHHYVRSTEEYPNRKENIRIRKKKLSQLELKEKEKKRSGL
jgi:hypothetical protein